MSLVPDNLNEAVKKRIHGELSKAFLVDELYKKLLSYPEYTITQKPEVIGRNGENTGAYYMEFRYNEKISYANPICNNLFFIGKYPKLTFAYEFEDENYYLWCTTDGSGHEIKTMRDLEFILKL
jgi:hypothetical protein